MYEDADDAVASLTACGSPHYVAPEIISKKPYDGRKADVWSLGIVLFFMLTGKRPFEGRTFESLFHKIRHQEAMFPTFLHQEAMFPTFH
eukprot:g15432.t1